MCCSSHLCPVAPLNLKVPCFIQGSIINALFPIGFDECLIRTSLTQILLEVDHALSSMQKPISTESTALAHKLPCASCHLLGWFSLLIVLSFNSSSDLVICFTVSLDTWVIRSLLLLPCSFPYSVSNHNIFLKTLSRCSEINFGSFKVFPFSGCLELSIPDLSITQKNLIQQILLKCLKGELKVNGDKRLPHQNCW